MPAAIVIGATSGIGRSLALMLAREGYRVGVTGRRAELLDELAASQPDSFVACPFDLTDTAVVPGKLDGLAAALDGVDLVVISSGTGELNDTLDFGIENRTIQTNAAGFTCAADWAFNFFVRRGRGHLAGITSVAGLFPGPGAPAYNATKAYQINYLRSLRQKARGLRKPVRITDIRPGFVDTAMAKGGGQFWVAPVEKAARQILHAIRRRRRVVYITRRWALAAVIAKFI